MNIDLTKHDITIIGGGEIYRWGDRDRQEDELLQSKMNAKSSSQGRGHEIISKLDRLRCSSKAMLFTNMQIS